MTYFNPPRRWSAALVGAALLGMAASVPARAAVVDRIAAVVNDQVIALSEVYELGGDYIYDRCHGDSECAAEVELEVLDALIKRALIRRELARLKMQVTGEEIDQAIDRIVRDGGLPDRDTLRQQLELEGTRWDLFREEIAERLRIQRFQQQVIAGRVVIHDDEIRDLYQRTVRKGAALEASLSALGIVIPQGAEPELEQQILSETGKLVGALNSGDLPWEEAVQQYDAAGLADIVGGRTYRQGQLTGPVDQVVFSADLGVVQPPIRVGNVLFIVRVDERGMGNSAVPKLDEVKEQLRNQIFQEKVLQAEEEWYQRTRRQSSVDILIGRRADG